MRISYDYDLSGWNTFGMKVSCGCFVEYGSAEELAGQWNAIRTGDDFPRPFLHIGRGSNLLFTGDFPGTVFHSDIRFIRPLTDVHPAAGQDSAEVLVEVGAGVIWDDFCRWCSENALWGPENLSGIPGETGAAAVQNIGAYGVEIKDIIRKVTCFDCVTGNSTGFRTSECRYGYRESIFKTSAKGRYVVTSVVFALSSEDKPRLEYGHVRNAVEQALSENGSAPCCSKVGTGHAMTPGLVRDVILSIRDSKLPDPEVVGSAGSFFKNPVIPRSDYERVASIARIEYGQEYEVPHFDAGSGFIKVPAAWLIDRCGWKGYREGNAGVWERQPLVIVNATGEASPREILDLESKIRLSVLEKFGVELQPEVEHI